MKDSGVRTFVVTGNTYATFAHAAVWGSTGTGVTYTGFDRGSTPSQLAASRARVFDEFGLWCQSGNVFSTFPNGATAYACAVPGGFSFYSQGIAYGYNGLSYGNAARAITPEDEPDLIAATASNGARGYVLKRELDLASGGAVFTATTREEIVSAIAAFDGRRDHAVPVYAQDGRTRLGAMTVVGTDAQAVIAADAP